MFSGIKSIFCKWTPWESQILGRLVGSLAPQHQVVLQAQLDAVTKIQRICKWVEIDLYVMKRGRVCWDGVPSFDDKNEFRLARAQTVIDGITAESELHCVSGHFFSIETNVPVKPFAFRPELRVEIRDVDSRYA